MALAVGLIVCNIIPTKHVLQYLVAHGNKTHGARHKVLMLAGVIRRVLHAGNTLKHNVQMTLIFSRVNGSMILILLEEVGVRVKQWALVLIAAGAKLLKTPAQQLAATG